MKKIDWYDIKNVLKKFLIITVPLTISILFFYNYLYKLEVEQSKQIIIEEQKQKTTILKFVIEDAFSEFYEDLLLVKNSDEMSGYLTNSDNKNLSEVEQMFLRVAQSKKNFDQIRIIDNNGQEIVRVNNSLESPELVKKENLQNKEDRYYYTETSQLPKDGIFISDMDLNVENGIIEQPYKPMIRMAAPLYSDKNIYKGILIINFCGQDLLDLFSHYFTEHEYNFVNSYLVNQYGYFLYNNDKNKTFGFMFENNDIKISNENQKLWDSIVLNQNGIYEDNNFVNYYMKLNPLSMINTYSSSNYSWFTVSSFDLNYLPGIQDDIIWGIKKFDLMVIIGINFLVFILVLLNYHFQKDKEQLNITQKIAENTNDAVIITDKETNIIYANEAFEKATQYKPEEVLGLKPSYFKSNKQSKHFYKKMWDEIERKGHWKGELWDRKKDGLLYPKKLSIIKTKDKISNKIRYIGIFSDMTKIKEDESNLEKLQNYNFDTNLPNENLMIRLINNSIADKNKLYIIYFTIENYNQWIIESEDISYFINILSNRVRHNLHEDDFIAQVSKNGFVIGISSLDSTKQIDKFVYDFINENKKSVFLKEKEIFFNIKLGISNYPKDGKEANDLITKAYLALESVMNNKDKRYEYFRPSIKNSFQKELEMNVLLRKAIQKNEFEVYYQPQIKIKNEKMVGAEALIRWNSEKLGLVSPVIFIPLAEKTGQIIDIGYWLIEQVMLDYLKFKEVVSQDFRLSINISPVQFKDSKLVDKFKELIEKYDINPKNIEIEITEGIFVKDFKFVNERLKTFQKIGATVAIDDFGTGFSSLTYLKELNIDKLKIDRSFIKDYPEKDNGDMCHIITNMGNRLSLKVITEGAETKEQVHYLESIGCDLIQGYYYSKPLPLKHFIEYSKENNNKYK